MSLTEHNAGDPLSTKIPLTGTELREFERKAIREYTQGEQYFHNRDVADFIRELVASDFCNAVAWEEFSKLAAGMENETVVFSLISSEYLAVGDLWISYMRKCRASEFILLCADKESFEHFSDHGCRCVRVRIPRLPSQQANLAGFNAKALVLTSLKFIATQRVLETGKRALFSDIDALWLKDVRQDLGNKDCDFAFQNVHSFPRPFALAWGFAACSGFFYAAPGKASLDFIQTANSYVAQVGDDQLALNIAIAQHSPYWIYSQPELVEILPQSSADPVQQALLFAVSTDLTGSAQGGDLKIVALAHQLYRRHLRLNLDVAAASVFHPNSPKEQHGKLRVFKQYGYT